MVAIVPPLSSMFSLKLLDQIELNFICSLQAIGGKKIYIFHPGHMTKMAAMPIYAFSPSLVIITRSWSLPVSAPEKLYTCITCVKVV